MDVHVGFVLLFVCLVVVADIAMDNQSLGNASDCCRGAGLSFKEKMKKLKSGLLVLIS